MTVCVGERERVLCLCGPKTASIGLSEKNRGRRHLKLSEKKNKWDKSRVGGEKVGEQGQEEIRRLLLWQKTA